MLGAAAMTPFAFSSGQPNPVFPHSIEIGKSGVHMPLVGLGTWLYNDSVAEAAVSHALHLGYHHVGKLSHTV